MYSTLYRFLRVFRPGELETQKYLRELHDTQKLSRPELEAWQLEKLQQLVHYAYQRVPYYRERFQGEGIHPQDIKSLQDFQTLPFLTREDIHSHLNTLVSPDFRGKLYLNKTGGSTGQPMQFFVDRSSWRWTTAQEIRRRSCYGVRPGDKTAWVWGALQDMPEWSWQRRLRAKVSRQRYMNAFSMTKAKMQAFAEMLVRWQPVMIRAYASALSLFAEFLKEREITGIRPKVIETTAEKVTGPQRQLLQEVFQSEVADCYASRELGTIAYECTIGGLHVCETRYVEIVANGQVVPAGQLGEVVVTSLHQFAMPFIRYKIGDMGIYEAGDCPCARGMPVLKEIVGRTHDFLVTADGQFVHGAFFAYMFREKPEVARYQVYQPDRYHLDVRVVCKTKVDSAWLDKVRNELQAHFGQSMHIALRVLDDIELTPAGKHRFIISQVEPDFM